MAPLTIYNTLTRKKESFAPRVAGKVGMYVCGPTVYDYFHVGNARTFSVFDMVSRWLRASGYDVTYVRNITDVDDKIMPTRDLQPREHRGTHRAAWWRRSPRTARA